MAIIIKWLRCECGKLHTLSGCTSASTCPDCERNLWHQIARAF